MQVAACSPVMPRIVPGNATMWLEVPVCYPARAGLPRHPPRVVRSSAETAERGDRPDGHRDDLVQDRLELLLREVVLILRSLGPPQLSLLEELESLD